MKTITIGREGKTGKLCISVDDKTTTVGKNLSVPTGVSRDHIRLMVDDEGQVSLQNLNIENDTFVNGIGVERKRIKEGDRIELGKERYQLSWEILGQIIPRYVDIKPLEEVWNDYQEQLLKLQIRERRSGVLRSATGLITMGAVVLSIFTGRDNIMFLVLYGLAAIISAVFFVKAYIDSAKMPRKQQEIRDSLPKKYVCPNCGQFLGNQSYEIISQRTACPHCKAIYKI
ncbi:MAG: FHA domain-containing protein [Prevotella sp.]|nr:FHA domain-containing protein [Prevotella sp.]